MGKKGKLSSLFVSKTSSFSLTADFYFWLLTTKKQDPPVSYSGMYCKKHYFQKDKDGEKKKRGKTNIINMIIFKWLNSAALLYIYYQSVFSKTIIIKTVKVVS